MSGEASEFLAILEGYYIVGRLPEPHYRGMEAFYLSYIAAAEQGGCGPEQSTRLLLRYLDELVRQCEAPYRFSIVHRKLREPVDYYRFGIDFIRPLVDESRSVVRGREYLAESCEQLQRGENVIFLANHQTEPDAQILSLLFEKDYPLLAEKLVFVAGHRVTTDPWAVPLSIGCDLLCIWSKKYVDSGVAEERKQKVEHNRSTIAAMQQMLDFGGVAIYVAPSGGRDRPDAEGRVDVAPFDPQSVELFLLAARHSRRPTHLYPMAMSTYALLPPPPTVTKELGEPRRASWTPVQVTVGAPWLDIAPVTKEGRVERAQALWATVRTLYLLEGRP